MKDRAIILEQKSKETWQLKAMCDSEMNLSEVKDIIWATGKCQPCGLGSSEVSRLLFSFWQHSGAATEENSPRVDTLKYPGVVGMMSVTHFLQMASNGSQGPSSIRQAPYHLNHTTLPTWEIFFVLPSKLS